MLGTEAGPRARVDAHTDMAMSACCLQRRRDIAEELVANRMGTETAAAASII